MRALPPRCKRSTAGSGSAPGSYPAAAAQAPVQSRLPSATHRTESPRRRRRGRRPGQASQRRRVVPGIHPPSQEQKAVDRLGLLSQCPTVELGQESELQLPDGLARAGLMKRPLRLPGKPPANLVVTRNHAPHASLRCACEQRRLRKTVSFFSLSATSAGNASAQRQGSRLMQTRTTFPRIPGFISIFCRDTLWVSQGFKGAV